MQHVKVKELFSPILLTSQVFCYTNLLVSIITWSEFFISWASNVLSLNADISAEDLVIILIKEAHCKTFLLQLMLFSHLSEIHPKGLAKLANIAC